MFYKDHGPNFQRRIAILTAGVVGYAALVGCGGNKGPATTEVRLSLSCDGHKKGEDAHLRTYVQVPGSLQVLLGRSADKLVTVEVNEGAALRIQASKGVAELSGPEFNKSDIQSRTNRAFQAGDDVVWISAAQAANNEVEITATEPCK